MIAAGSGPTKASANATSIAGDRPQGRTARGVGQGRRRSPTVSWRSPARCIPASAAFGKRAPPCSKSTTPARRWKSLSPARAQPMVSGRSPIAASTPPQALHHAQIGASSYPARLQADCRRAHRRWGAEHDQRRLSVISYWKLTRPIFPLDPSREADQGQNAMTAARKPDYDLLIDIGNTFLKWGLFRARAGGEARENRLESGHCCSRESPGSPRSSPSSATPAQIVISNVAGTRVRAMMSIGCWNWPACRRPHGYSEDEQYGVRNHYRNPAQLGSDRWAALIGARQIVGAKPALVRVAGPDDDPLPDGRRRIQRRGDPAGRREADARRPASAASCRAPANTSKIRCRRSTPSPAAASTRRPARSSASGACTTRNAPGLVCVLSGGAARALAPRLTIPFELHDNLVLEGLYCISPDLARLGAARQRGLRRQFGAGAAARIPSSRSRAPVLEMHPATRRA